jgi:hypothetical protein
MNTSSVVCRKKREIWRDESKFDANIKRESTESCIHWIESDVIGIISGLVHVEFQKFISEYAHLLTGPLVYTML